jgi:hypothetical protein
VEFVTWYLRADQCEIASLVYSAGLQAQLIYCIFDSFFDLYACRQLSLDDIFLPLLLSLTVVIWHWSFIINLCLSERNTGATEAFNSCAISRPVDNVVAWYWINIHC